MTDLENVAAATSDQTASEPSQVETTTTEPAAPLAEKKPPTIAESLAAAYDKSRPPRDPVTKRFVPRSGTPAPATTEDSVPTLATEGAEETPDQPATETQEPAQPAIQPPMSWSGEMKAKWAEIPPAQQAYITQRDKETHDAISRAGQQIKAYEPIGSVIGQFQETFKRNNLHPAEGIARLLAVEEQLAKDPVGTIQRVAEAYGVNLQSLTGQSQEGEQQQPDAALIAVKAQLAETQNQLRQVTSYLTAQQEGQTNAQRDALARQIAEFADAKDAGGNLKHPHLDQVTSLMVGLLQADQNLDLERAYDYAVNAHPDIRSQLRQAEQKAAEEKRKVEAARKMKDAKNAAAVNVQSSPAHGQNPKTMKDTLSELDAKFYGVR